MKITEKQFLDDVKHEIDMIKKLATEEEKENLDIEELSPINAERCIYGQMTGDCRSHRANELISSCCARIFNIKEDSLSCVNKNDFNEVAKNINGKFSNQGWKKMKRKSFVIPYASYRRDWKYLSLLEGFISLYRHNNKNILSYITGEIEELTLTL